MKLNLTKLKIKPTLKGEAVEQDLTAVVAEAIYSNCASLAEMKFAIRLSDTKGDIDITKEEVAFIRKALPAFRYWVQMPILEQLNDENN